MVLAAPGPLLTPPPSSSPPKTPHRSYSAQTRSQDEEKNPSPKQYLPPQTRTRHRRAHRPHVTTLMQGNTPPTSRSPPYRSRLTGNPPNLQPVTVSGWRMHCGAEVTESSTNKQHYLWRTPMRAAPDCRPPPTARHASQPRSSSTSHPPQQQEKVHRSCAPARMIVLLLFLQTTKPKGRGPEPAQDRCAAPLGRLRAPPGPRPRRRPPRRRSPFATRSLPTTTVRRKGGHPVVSNRPLHRVMQQRDDVVYWYLIQ